MNRPIKYVLVWRLKRRCAKQPKNYIDIDMESGKASPDGGNYQFYNHLLLILQ